MTSTTSKRIGQGGVWLTLVLMSCGGAGGAHVETPEGPDPVASAWPEVEAAPLTTLRTQTRPLPRDLAALRRVRAIQISPDSSLLAYVVHAPEHDPDATSADDNDQGGGWSSEQQLFVVSRDGGEPLQLTFGEGSVRAPRWSPDGRYLAFMRRASGTAAIHVLHLGGGEARVVEIDGDYEPSDYAWSSDGRRFAFTAARPSTDEQRATRFRVGGARRFDREWEQQHLFIVDREGGEPRHVNRGSDSIVSFAWSPDDERFAVVTSRTSDPYEAVTLDRVSVISARDGSVVAEVQPEPTAVAHIAWSLDGRRIAWERADGGFVSNQLIVHDLEAGTSRDVTAALDPTLSGFSFSEDALLVHVLAHTRSQLWRVPLDGGQPSEIDLQGRALRGMHADRAGRYLGTLSSSSHTPPDPTVIDAVDEEVRVVAHVNPQVSEWSLGAVEVVRWRNADGVELEGVFRRPPDAVQGQASPLLVLPHGGPDSVSLESFNTWAIYFAARGYAVFRPNYRGGIGYGAAFYAANRGRLGAIEFEDIEPGVDHLIESGVADPDQLFYGGWSWGGYISAWTLGHSTRYRAFVVGAGVVDVAVQYTTSDINHGVVADWEFDGRPWRDPSSFARSNPARSLQDATSPTLILHGERDTRVAFVNGQMLYRALRDAECEVEMFAYPRENHGFREPAHVEHMLGAWAGWYDAHLP